MAGRSAEGPQSGTMLAGLRTDRLGSLRGRRLVEPAGRRDRASRRPCGSWPGPTPSGRARRRSRTGRRASPGLLVERGAPDAVGLEHEPARNGVDFFPTQHPSPSCALLTAPPSTLQAVPACVPARRSCRAGLASPRRPRCPPHSRLPSRNRPDLGAGALAQLDSAAACSSTAWRSSCRSPPTSGSSISTRRALRHDRGPDAGHDGGHPGRDRPALCSRACCRSASSACRRSSIPRPCSRAPRSGAAGERDRHHRHRLPARRRSSSSANTTALYAAGPAVAVRLMTADRLPVGDGLMLPACRRSRHPHLRGDALSRAVALPHDAVADLAIPAPADHCGLAASCAVGLFHPPACSSRIDSVVASRGRRSISTRLSTATQFLAEPAVRPRLRRAIRSSRSGRWCGPPHLRQRRSLSMGGDRWRPCWRSRRCWR